MSLFGRLEVNRPTPSTFSRMIVNNCDVVPLTKSTEKLTKTFSVIFSLAKIVGGERKKEPGTEEGTAVTWLLRGLMWHADPVHFLRAKPTGPLRGPMTKFLFTWHLRGLGWCVEPGAFSACETQWPTQRPDDKDCCTVRAALQCCMCAHAVSP